MTKPEERQEYQALLTFDQKLQHCGNKEKYPLKHALLS